MAMEYSFQELKQTLFGKVFEVYDIFKDYFGEPYVDLQGIPSEATIRNCAPSYDEETQKFTFYSDPYINLVDNPFIMVWWPTVTITNEYGKSVDIEDLYAKISLQLGGTISNYYGFTLNRSTYSLLQYSSDYMHSHVSGIPRDPSQFKTPCLGKGPIQHTIESLRREFDPITWMLFCNELAAYVTVESVSGIPYRRLENIGGNASSSNDIMIRNIPRCNDFCSAFSTDTLKDFILYYLENGHLKFNFSEHAYSLGMSFYDYLVDVSNSFIDYYNANFKDIDAEFLFTAGILNKRIVSNGRICKPPSNINTDLNNIGSHVCTFKGKDITLTVHDTGDNDCLNTSIILGQATASGILQSILTILNYRYANSKSTENIQYDPITGRELYASSGKTVRYI